MLRWTGNSFYDGEFVDGKFHGEGLLQQPGLIYQGAFIKGEKHGKGVLIHRDGTRYEGIWDAQMLGGVAKVEWPQGSYEGEVRGGRFHGKGELRYRNGQSYQGEFANGLRHGVGRMCHPARCFESPRNCYPAWCQASRWTEDQEREPVNVFTFVKPKPQ